MPLLEDLLKPIPGMNPSGLNLRYDPVYDKIREARRADEELQLSEEASKADVWTRAVRKKANFVQVIELSIEALSNRTKDLQIAAWLAEALLAEEKISGLTQGLNLISGLLDKFWGTVYPEIEDGDLEMRVGPIEWVGTRLDLMIHRVPLAKNKLDWFKFQESRRTGYNTEVRDHEANALAIEEKKCTREEFDKAVKDTGEAYYRQLTADLAASGAAISALETRCDEKFGREAPNFANLKKALEDLQDAVREIWSSAEEAPEREVILEETIETDERPVISLVAPERPPTSNEPAGPDDAVTRIIEIVRFLRFANPANPVSYMILRGLRWGELRANGPTLDLTALAPPTSEMRQQLKQLAMDGDWNDLLEASEAAMSLTCGRGWLDLQRYTVRACEAFNYEAVALALRGGLRSLLTDYPQLLSISLSDDTPAANGETQAWIRESILPISWAPWQTAARTQLAATEGKGNGSMAADVHEIAQQAVRAGRVQEAIQLLSEESTHERSGRARFQRKVQLASICLSTKHEVIAYPILAELAEEIDRRRLDEWEESASLAKPLALLFRCMDRLGYDEAAKQRVYQRLCRLDPVQALSSMS
jgi:type VI secretion system protein ImpA